MRVALNSTFGLFGLIDIATPAGLKNNKTSLGDTFAHWGWKNSNYLVLPFFGPSTVRDGLGLGVSLGINGPEHLVYHNSNEAIAFYGVYGVNTRARYLDFDDSLATAAIDPYTYMRDGFLQLRATPAGTAQPTQNDDINIDDLVSSPAAASAPAGGCTGSDGQQPSRSFCSRACGSICTAVSTASRFTSTQPQGCFFILPPRT
jgi:phospholipid-binding lipoprotein MlaA